jgi:hypothetical protein
MLQLINHLRTRLQSLQRSTMMPMKNSGLRTSILLVIDKLCYEGIEWVYRQSARSSKQQNE